MVILTSPYTHTHSCNHPQAHSHNKNIPRRCFYLIQCWHLLSQLFAYKVVLLISKSSFLCWNELERLKVRGKSYFMDGPKRGKNWNKKQ